MLLAGALVIGAVLGAITVGAIVGTGLTALPTVVAIALIGVIAGMIDTVLDGEIEGTVNDFGAIEILPPELNSALGLVAPNRVRFDDLEIAGELTLPRRRPTLPTLPTLPRRLFLDPREQPEFGRGRTEP